MCPNVHLYVILKDSIPCDFRQCIPNMILGLNEPLIAYLLATKNALKDPLPPL